MTELIYSLNKEGLKSSYLLLEKFSLFLVLFFIVVIASFYIFLKLKSPDKLSDFKKISLGISIGFSLTLIFIIGFLMIARLVVKEEITLSFYLILGFLGLSLIFVLALLFSSANKKLFMSISIIGTVVLFVYGFILLFVIPVENNDYLPLNNGFYVFTAILVAVPVILCLIFDKENKPTNTKSIAFAGICIALSFALSYVKLFSLPQGGSVTLASMLPLIIYSYVFGIKKGVFAGVIYGILQCIQSPQIYQPLQVIIDYPLAFGLIGLSGLFNKTEKIKRPVFRFILGASLGCVLRYFAHLISGYYVFSSWAMEGYTALSWTVIYNLYVIVDLFIVLIVGGILFSSKTFVKQLVDISENN